MAGEPEGRILLDALDEPALVVGGGRVIAANAAALKMLGRGIVGRDQRLAIRHPQLLASIRAARRADLAIVGLGGSERPWTVALRPIAHGGSLLVRFVDRSEALAAERMRVDFVANASHELRTPLATIAGYAETLQEAGLPEELRQRFARTVGEEAARMLRIVEDLMSLSRIEASRFVLPGERCDLAEVARLAVVHAAPLAADAGCDIALDVPDEGLMVAGDRAQLMQLLDNLIGNAVRYGGAGVAVRAATVRGRPLLEVRDSGPGIAAVHLPRLTERFYRVDDARSRTTGGTGLGLAIVKHIVERHRATLDIRSMPGKGTCVSVTFPPV